MKRQPLIREIFGNAASEVIQGSLLAFESEVRLDDVLDRQARSMIAPQRRAMIQKKLAALALALGLLLGTPGLPAAGANFNFTTIDVPHSTRTAANGDSTHAIAGEFDDAGGITHGFVLSGGVYTTIDVPGASLTSVNGISARGQLAGTYQDTTSFHAYFRSTGSFTTLDPPGSIRSQGGFLNAQGQVVGTYRDQNNKRHGFIWRNGVFTALQINVPGDNPVGGTVAIGINDPGKVVGDYVDNTTPNPVRHGFLLSQGVYTTLDPPGTSLTVAEGINNAGVIVGFYLDAAGKEHGFVLSGGVYTTVDIPKSTGTQINSINAQGVIVGFYDDANGSTHGFVGTPAQ
jgi:probable HAF family extracellular repeat protein